ncbi:hypothetical protein EVAR_86254_1 [Eumeta japonica]|uniref:Uncharacterized protein n=1 Tax=Eumeta variegata TaxID=151549 RepID=A0A4C1UCM8_EUMVA|nr:hypothetical protein EVAR_86254_1 [Eumeta japonica]
MHSGEPNTREDVLNLRILYWNPGGIIGKTRELRDLAQLEDAHITLLGETKLRPEQELSIPNFFAYRRDEISARGPDYRGTTVLIRRDLMHEVEQLTDFETMRLICIRVDSSEQVIRLFAAYRRLSTRGRNNPLPCVTNIGGYSTTQETQSLVTCIEHLDFLQLTRCPSTSLLNGLLI